MLKKKLETANLFSPKKREIIEGTPKRTLLILDGEQNSYNTIEEITENILTIPSQGALWLDMPLFKSHDNILTVAHSFKLSPNAQNILEDKKQHPHLLVDGNNRMLICRHLKINDLDQVTANNICFAISANRLLSLQHSRIDRLENARLLVTTLKDPKNTIAHALTLILGKIIDENHDIVATLEERTCQIATAYSEQNEAPDSRYLLQLRRSLIVSKQAICPMKKILNASLQQNPPLLKGCHQMPELLIAKLESSFASIKATEELLSSLETLCINAKVDESSSILSTLTTITSVLLPLIFITSLFAMNFKYMPELQATWGYPLCLLLLAIVAIIINKKIKQKKWY